MRLISLLIFTCLFYVFVPSIAQNEALDSSISADLMEANIAQNQMGASRIRAQENDSYRDVPLPEARKEKKEWWVFLFAVFILIIIGILKNLNPNRHRLSFMSYWMSPKVENEIQEDNYGIDFFQVTQIVVSCFMLGWMLLLFQPFDLNFTLNSDFMFLLFWILIVTLLYMLKYFGHYIIGLIFQADRLAKLMVFSQSNMMYAVSLVVFPCLMIYYYVPDVFLQKIMVISILSLLIIHLILRLIKSFRIYFELFPYRRIYIFIYLCALEILPFLVLLDVIGMNLKGQ